MKLEHQNTFENLTITQSYLNVIYNSINFADKHIFKCIRFLFTGEHNAFVCTYITFECYPLKLSRRKKTKKSNEMLNVFFTLKKRKKQKRKPCETWKQFNIGNFGVSIRFRFLYKKKLVDIIYIVLYSRGRPCICFLFNFTWSH